MRQIRINVAGTPLTLVCGARSFSRCMDRYVDGCCLVTSILYVPREQQHGSKRRILGGPNTS